VADAGAGLACLPLTKDGLTRAVREVLLPDVRKRLSGAAQQRVRTNGAMRAAQEILGLAS
jgi:UDP-N-acetylglucosamine--N-acetylmuramyl-(pentapeptide) pyrophosphoryl-undecaprenol N-acetylglucosamine transferase